MPIEKETVEKSTEIRQGKCVIDLGQRSASDETALRVERECPKKETKDDG